MTKVAFFALKAHQTSFKGKNDYSHVRLVKSRRALISVSSSNKFPFGLLIDTVYDYLIADLEIGDF